MLGWFEVDGEERRVAGLEMLDFVCGREVGGSLIAASRPGLM